MELTAEYLRSALNYDPETGVMVWLDCSKYHSEKNGKQAGQAAPGTTGKAYWKISIGGKKHSRSRLAFLWMTGEQPTDQIDHINGNSLDDRWVNLREATVTENAWNHKTRRRTCDLPMGVRKAASGRFVARIAQNGRLYTIGTFDTPVDASIAYQKEREARYGKFA